MKKTAFVSGRYALCLNLVLAAASVPAADYYVSTSGNDANSGTSAQPFRTISHAYSVAGAGTTIHVLPGTYTDYQSGWGLHLGKSGTAASPIVLRSETRGAAILDGQNAADRNQGIYIDGNYNVVDGFEIKNGTHGGISIWSSGNKILNNHIHNNGNPADSGTNGRDGVYEDQNGSGNVFAGNYIHDNGRAGGSNLDHGLYLCGKNDLVYNNVSIRNDGSGLQIAGYSTVSNMKVYNNVFAWNGTEGIIVWMAMNGVDIKNNISYHNGLYGIYFYAATGSGVVMDHNVVYANGSGNYSAFNNGGSTVSYTLGTTISSDPGLVNESSSGFDAHLSASSPAIGAGYNFYSLFTTDLEGALRPSSGAWDLGACVYGAAATLPTVTVAATAPYASRVGPTNGVFTITRASGTNASLTVNYSLGGTALSSADYATLGTSLTIPIGATSASVTVTPLASTTCVGPRTVVFTLAPNPAYVIGSATNAAVTIAGNTLPSAISKAPSNSFKIIWPSAAGKVYRVACKNSLRDTSWTNLSGLITATGASTSYADTTARLSAQRYYLVYVTN